MANPKTFTKQSINTTSDQDALQIKDVKGDILGWIDSTGTGQGNLASGGGGGATINPTNNVLPVRSNSTTFADSPASVDANGNLEAGKGQPNPSPNTSAGLTIVGSTDVNNIGGTLELHNSFAVGIDAYTHSGTGFRAPFINLYKSRGTQSSPTGVKNTDSVGGHNFGGYDGSVYAVGAALSATATEDWTPTARGSNIKFQNTLVGSTILATPIVCTTTTVDSFVGINNGTPTFSLHTDNKAVALGAPPSAPTDGNLINGQVSFYLDEVGNNLKIRVKYSNGTLKTATIALT